jgi:hypothetical protein
MSSRYQLRSSGRDKDTFAVPTTSVSATTKRKTTKYVSTTHPEKLRNEVNLRPSDQSWHVLLKEVEPSIDTSKRRKSIDAKQYQISLVAAPANARRPSTADTRMLDSKIIKANKSGTPDGL